jgi:uncharacterized SAM-dependent methyltransferase
MFHAANVTIHASQFPDAVRRDLLESLRTRCVNHKFHYDSLKQTQKWLALHQAYSPTRNDADCQAMYERSFAAAAARLKSRRIHVIGLGCGGGQKDTRLLKLLRAHDREAFYTPCDVSVAMVLTAWQTALAVVPAKYCFPLVCDLATMDDLAALHASLSTLPASRIITFFGMIPNFEPGKIMPKLASLIRPRDFLLFSANLAPGKNYAAGLQKILPQYDNPFTRDWLMTFLADIGIGHGAGDLRFTVERGQSDLKRVMARFHFRRACKIEIESEVFNFKTGDLIQVFFSYRYTPERVRKTLVAHDLEVLEQWIAPSEQEGVFLCRRTR